MKNLSILSLSLAIGLSLTASLYSADNAVAPTESPNEFSTATFEWKKKNLLNDIEMAKMSLDKKAASLERLIAVMSYLKTSNYETTPDFSESLKYQALKKVIHYNVYKLEQVKKDIMIQEELNAYIKENLETFVLVGQEVDKLFSLYE